MLDQARVVIIGGGIAGCSTLYHLTQEGWTDVLLLERDELTSGTTWHSAAQVTNFGGIQTMVGLKTHSINLYKELADDPDYPINYHHGTGGLRLASQDWHFEGYQHFISMAAGMGVDFEWLDAAECKRRHPLISTHNLMGALWDPLDGDIDPAQLCQALARRARNAGARVKRHLPVTGLTQKADHSWIVHTENGDIAAEMIVNAGGYRCNEIAAMMGTELPVASMEHQYMLTQPIPEIEALDFRVPLIRCPTDDFYQRQEKNGLLIGFYEQGCKTWGLEGIDPDFTNALCPNDLDRCIDVMEGAFSRLPCLEEAGIHTIVNGPITYTPDGFPLVGRVPGFRNAWCITGLRAGLGEGGGHGWLLAQTMVHGEAEYDTWALDPRRFSCHAGEEYTALKAIEDYQNEFRFHRPHEHRPAGRPLKTTPLYLQLLNEGAEMGVVAGWERALFFKTDPDFVDEHSFRFTPTRAVVAAEVDHLVNHCSVMEVSGFNRIEISGEGAADWVNGLVAGRVPVKDGKVSLAYTLTEQGNVLSEATLARFSKDRFWWGSAAAAENHDLDWLRKHLPTSGITLKSLTYSHTILVIAGPKARALLSDVAPRTDWSPEGFPWLKLAVAHIGHIQVVAMAVSFSGELAFELHIPNEQLVAAYDLIREAGKSHNLGRFGLYATESMRLEKGYLGWKSELMDERNPFETGLDRFVKLDKPSFPGRDPLLAKNDAGPVRKLVSLLLQSEKAPAHGGDSVRAGGEVIGSVTSGGYGHRTGENLAMAFIEPGFSEIGQELDVQVLGELVRAKVVEPVRYDPKMERLKS